MVAAGFVTEGQVAAARRNPATSIARSRGQAPDWYLDWAFEEIKRIAPPGDRTITVRTTLDPRIQKAARRRSRATCAFTAPTTTSPRRATVVMDVSGGVRAMVWRARLRRERVQSRHRRAAPAGVLVQAVRLCSGDDERLFDGQHRSRRADLDRQLESPQLRPLLRRAGAAAHGAGQVDQHHPGPHRPGDRTRQDRRDGARARHHDRARRSPGRCRSASPRSTCSTWPAPIRPSPTPASRRPPTRSRPSPRATAPSSTTAPVTSRRRSGCCPRRSPSR